METIGDLRGLRRPRCGASGIVLGTGAGNNVDAWMSAQPRRDGLGSTLWQEIHRPTAVESD
jgi:hypothetical protein